MVDQLAEPLIAAEGADDGPPSILHAEAASRAHVVAARRPPSQRVRLEADGAVVLGGAVGLDQVGGVVGVDLGGDRGGRGEPRSCLVPYGLDALD